MTMFANMKVARKLLLLLAVMLIGFTAIGGTYYAVLQAEDAAIIGTQTTTQFQIQIENVKQEIAQAVIYQRDFLLTKRLEKLDDFETQVTGVRDVLSGLEAQAPSAALKLLITPVNTILDTFHGSVYQLANIQLTMGLTQETGLQGDMRNAGQELESALTQAIETLQKQSVAAGRRSSVASSELNRQRLLTSILTMRRHERDYLQDKVQKYIDRMTEERSHFIELVDQSSLVNQTKAGLNRLLTTYQDNFDTMAKATVELEQGRVAVDAAFVMIAPTLAAMSKETEKVTVDKLAALEASRSRLNKLFLAVLILTAVSAVLIMFFISRGITTPLSLLQGAVQRVADGDMDARARLAQSDEIGQLANAFDNLLDERIAQLAETERERAAQLAEAERENDVLNNSVVDLLFAVAQLSRRDLTIKVPVAEDVTGPLSDALNLLTEETSKVLVEVTQISTHVALASRNVKSQSNTVAALAAKEREQVTQTSQELATAAEAMNAIALLAQECDTAGENAIQRTQAALDTVTGTVQGINATRDTIRETEKRIKRLGERSQEISGVVNLINNIAERTHILALNASMHAASAGEAGRGFAVVADEVQRLAENARQATEQIASLVSNIQMETMDTVTTMNIVITQVVEGSRLAEQAGEQMRETQQTTAALVASVRQIAAGSQTQARISNELSDRATQIVDSTVQTSHQLEEQGTQTTQLLDYANQLVQSVRVFTLPGGVTESSAATDSMAEEAESEDTWEVRVEA